MLFHSLLIAFCYLYCYEFWFGSWDRRLFFQDHVNPSLFHFPTLPFDWMPFCRGMEGRMSGYATTIQAYYPHYNQWHSSFTPPYHPVSKWPAFPSRLSPFLGFCVLITMSFYNMLLKCRGHNWNIWRHHTCKTILPNCGLWIYSLFWKYWFSRRFTGHRTQIYDPLKDSVQPALQPLPRSSRKHRSRSIPAIADWLF